MLKTMHYKFKLFGIYLFQRVDRYTQNRYYYNNQRSNTVI